MKLQDPVIGDLMKYGEDQQTAQDYELAVEQRADQLGELTVNELYDRIESASADRARPPSARQKLWELQLQLDELITKCAQFRI